MGSSYFPSQIPLYIVQLAIQDITLTESSNSAKIAKHETISASFELPQGQIQKPSQTASPHKAKEDLEKKIQTNFKNNLTEYQHAYMNAYVDKDIISAAELYEGNRRIMGGGSLNRDGYPQKTTKDKKFLQPTKKPNGSKPRNKNKSKLISSHRSRGLRDNTGS